MGLCSLIAHAFNPLPCTKWGSFDREPQFFKGHVGGLLYFLMVCMSLSGIARHRALLCFVGFLVLIYYKGGCMLGHSK